MKKKLMMVTLLLAGLTMGACVDDKESASVTAVRDAKTEQLESVAAMNSAAAEARQAMAAAEAALRLAEAEAQQAAAALKKANAEYEQKQSELVELQKEEQTIENQRRQAELEAQLAQLEVEKKKAEQQLAKIQADMEKAQIEAEKNLVTAQIAMKNAEMALLNYEQQLAEAKTQAERDRIEAERIELQTLASAYSRAVEELNLQKSNLLYLKANLVRAENKLAKKETLKQEAIAKNNNEIAQLQAEIEVLKQYTNYQEDFETLKSDYNTLSSAYNLANDQYYAAYNAYNNYTLDLTISQELEAIVYNDVLSKYANRELVDENGEPYVKSDGSRIWPNSDVRNVLPYRYSWSSSKKYVYEEGDYRETGYLGDSLRFEFDEMGDLRQFELTIEWYLQYYKSNLEAAVAYVEDCQTAYDDAVEATKQAKEALDNAAEADKAACRTAYDAAVQAENSCKADLDAAIVAQADAQLVSDCFDKEVDIIRNFDTYKAALQAKIDARNEQQVKEYEEKVALWMDMTAKKLVKDLAQEAFNAISVIMNGRYGGYYEAGAEDITIQIANKEARIKKLTAKNEDFSKVTEWEEIVDLLKEQVAAQEDYVKVYEILANQAKADLDAAMAKYAAAEE